MEKDNTDDTVISPARHLRKIVRSNTVGAIVLKEIEKEIGEKINFYSHKGTSYWGDLEDKPAIVIDSRDRRTYA